MIFTCTKRLEKGSYRDRHVLVIVRYECSVQAQDRPQPPQLSPVFQTPHWPYRAVPLRYWQSDNRTSTAVLPHLRATQKGNLARTYSRSPQALRKPQGPAMHCHLHRGDWSFHLTNDKKKSEMSWEEAVYPSKGGSSFPLRLTCAEQKF